MIDDAFFEGEAVCGEIPLEDILDYADLSFEAQTSRDVKYKFDKLRKRGYGHSIKEIDARFKQHFKSCYICNQTYQDELEGICEAVDSIGEALKATHPIMSKVIPEYQIMFRRFPIEHIDMGEEAENLRQYIMLKVWHPKRIKDNEAFNQHIKNCDYCNSFRILSIMMKLPDLYLNRDKQ